MKVLMLGPGRQDKGGIATVVNQYYDVNIDRKVDLKYISTMHDGNKCKKAITALYALCDYVKEIDKYDIVHVHMSARNSFYRKKIFIEIAKKKNKIIIIHVHGSEFDVFYNQECNEKQKEQIKKIFAMADMVVVLSAEWKDFFKTICDENKIKILHNAVVVPEYKKKSISNHNILFLGRLGKRKGIYDLLEIMPNVIDKIPDVHLYYGGDGEIEEVKERVKQLNLQNNCTYLGWIDGTEKNKMLEKCSVFILPSYHEGMPMAILEAMSYSSIVVSTYIGGIPQVIKNEINGYLFEAGDLIGLENSLLKAFDENGKEEIAYNAYKTMKEEFDVENNIEILCEWYQQLIAIRRGGKN